MPLSGRLAQSIAALNVPLTAVLESPGTIPEGVFSLFIPVNGRSTHAPIIFELVLGARDQWQLHVHVEVSAGLPFVSFIAKPLGQYSESSVISGVVRCRSVSRFESNVPGAAFLCWFACGFNRTFSLSFLN
jgi:hypothetical protein